MKVFKPEVIENCPYTAVITYPPTEAHRNTFYKIMFVESGSSTLSLSDKRTRRLSKKLHIKSGDIIIVRPEDVSWYTDVEEGINGYRHRDIYIPVERMKECCDFLSKDLYDEISSQRSAIDFRITTNQQLALSESLASLANKKVSEEYDMQHKSIVVYCLGAYLQYKSTQSLYPLWLNGLLRDLENINFLVQPVSEIACSTNYTHEYVSRKFKHYVGKTLKQYVNECRLSAAALLLATSELSVEEISIKTGFPTYSNFINAFKREYDIPPGQYRKALDGKILKDTYVEWND